MQELKNDYTDEKIILGFWRFSSFVRFLYREILRLRSENKELIQSLIDSNESIRLTNNIKETNNTSGELENASNNSLALREGESIEDYWNRVSYLPKSSNITVRSSSQMIDEAKQRHLEKDLDNISDNAIDRIASKLARGQK